MNEIALAERIERIHKEMKLAGGKLEDQLLALRAENDRLRLELAAIKSFLGTAFPGFEEQFPQILARTIAEVDPEFN